MRYRAEWTTPVGVTLHKSFSTKANAEHHLAEQVTDMRRGVYVARSKRVLLADYAETWKRDQLHQRASSREQVENPFRLNILPALGGMAMDAVQRPDVQAKVGK